MTLRTVHRGQPAVATEKPKAPRPAEGDGRTEYATFGQPAFPAKLDEARARRLVEIKAKPKQSTVPLRPWEEQGLRGDLAPVRQLVAEHRELPDAAKRLFNPANPNDPRGYIQTPSRLRDELMAAFRKSLGAKPVSE